MVRRRSNKSNERSDKTRKFTRVVRDQKKIELMRRKARYQRKLRK